MRFRIWEFGFRICLLALAGCQGPAIHVPPQAVYVAPGALQVGPRDANGPLVGVQVGPAAGPLLEANGPLVEVVAELRLAVEDLAASVGDVQAAVVAVHREIRAATSQPASAASGTGPAVAAPLTAIGDGGIIALIAIAYLGSRMVERVAARGWRALRQRRKGAAA